MLKKVLKATGYTFISIFVCVAAFVVFGLVRFSQLSEEKHPLHPELASLVKTATQPDIEVGRRIYYVRNGCVECHGNDLSGAVIMENGPMGSIHGANITPYKTKNLSDEELVRAIRYGVHPTGRSLRFMPSFDYQDLSKEDLLSLVAFIRSVPEVTKEDHMNTFGPVARIMGAIGKMPVLFPAKVIDHSKGFGTKPPEQPTADFGKYLAHACTGCHGADFRGGPIPGGDPSWPHASNIRLGALGWDRAAFIEVVQTGVARSTHQPLKAPMPVAALQQMTETEKEALWKFLSSLD